MSEDNAVSMKATWTGGRRFECVSATGHTVITDAPAEVGGGQWTYDKAWAFLNAHANMEEGFLRFELDRYLGWPGQAPSYKIGERLWLQIREELSAREGDAFDLKAFHRRALDIGSVGLDVLRSALLP